MAVKAWDQYVADAKRDPIEIPLPKGGSVTASMPLGRQIEAINDAARVGNHEVLLDELFGKAGAKKLRALAAEAPAFALGHLINDVVDELGFTIPVLDALRQVHSGKGEGSTPADSST